MGLPEVSYNFVAHFTLVMSGKAYCFPILVDVCDEMASDKHYMIIKGSTYTELTYLPTLDFFLLCTFLQKQNCRLCIPWMQNVLGGYKKPSYSNIYSATI